MIERIEVGKIYDYWGPCRELESGGFLYSGDAVVVEKVYEDSVYVEVKREDSGEPCGRVEHYWLDGPFSVEDINERHEEEKLGQADKA